MSEREYRVRDPSGRERVIRGPDDASDEEIIAQAQKMFLAPESVERSAPSTMRVIKNAANKAIAGVPDAVLNTPSNIINLAKAAGGFIAGELGASADSLPAVSAPPDLARKGFAAAGLIRPEDEPATSGQRVLDAAVQGGVGTLFAGPRSLAQGATMFGTGLLSGATGQEVSEATGSAPLGQAASMLTPFAVQGVARGAANTVDSLRQASQRNAVRDATHAEARSQGYVFPPSETSGGFLNNRLESIAGKAALGQDATRRNQQVTTRLAVEELGLPPNTPLTVRRLEQYRDSVSQPYQEVASLSPMAADVLQRLRQRRFDANRWSTWANRSGDPAAQDQAVVFRQQADALETALERIAQRANRPELIPDLREARTNIAKSYDIERALNLGDASVSAPTIGRAYDRGRPLTGNLQTIGATQQAEPFRRFMGEGASTPGVSALEPVMMGAGGVAAARGNIPGAIVAAGLPLIRDPARSLLLSNAYQNLMMPHYNPSRLTSLLSRLPQTSVPQTGLTGLLAARSIQELPEQ